MQKGLGHLFILSGCRNYAAMRDTLDIARFSKAAE